MAPALVLALLSAPAAGGQTAEQIYEKLRETYPHNTRQDPQLELESFDVHPEFEVNLFAAAPWVVNPIAMCWDPDGRLWVINGPTYPHILPGQEQTDFVSVLEDSDNDGRADKCTIFYDKLYVPTGIELGDGGAYVANQPDLLHLADDDGDLVAERRRILLSGFGTEDNHHAISAFVWGPGGHLYFQSGIFLHSQVETPHGVVRLDNGGVFQLRPRSLKLGLFNVGTATNPWGHAFDKWGQSFLTEGPQGGIWFLTPGTVASHPSQRVPGTRAPKSCGVEFLYSSHFSEEYRDKMVLNAFKNKTVNFYEFNDDGAGYATRELEPLLLVSRGPNFRPVDVELGPDGAIYIADFHQPVIGHMQYQFRDPRRDHLNGHIWRITQKGRELLPKPKLTSATAGQLAENLKSTDSFVRDKSRRLLYERDAATASDALSRYIEQLDTAHAEYERHRLEALWAYQTIGVVEADLLLKVLRSPEPRARAAATRVLRYWRNDVPYAFELLSKLVEDPFPRVRLEALCALSAFDQPETIELAAKAVDWPMDRFLDYAFQHTAISLKENWLPALEAGTIDFDGRANRIQAALSAVNAPGTAAILLRLLKADELSSDRRVTALTTIARLGTAAELAEVFDAKGMRRLLDGDDGAGVYNAGVHERVLAALADSARQRNVKPAVDADELSHLLSHKNQSLRSAAIRLAGAWQAEPFRDRLTEYASDVRAAPGIRTAAIDALAELGGSASGTTFRALSKSDQPYAVRNRAIAGWADLDLKAAAVAAAELLANDPGEEDPERALDAILAHREGEELLVASLTGRDLNVDAAKLSLRHMNATGKQQAGIISLLRKSIGTGSLTKQLDATAIKELMEEVLAAGDPFRGETVFRRKDLACLSCHAVAGGGAAVGPDLEGIGASSPLDYIVHSVLNPNKAVREGYAAVTVLTDAGRIHTGILKAKTQKQLTMLDATTRTLRQLPLDSIDETLSAPSLMPKGLVDNMTRTEFIDLVRFLHELGRPGPFATRNAPVVRTWRVLERVPDELSGHNVTDISRILSPEEPLHWKPAYSRVGGELPLQDFGSQARAFVQAEIDVGTAGEIRLRINLADGLALWVDNESVPVSKNTLIQVSQGLHTLTFGVERNQRNGQGLRVRLDDFNVPGSPARARIVNGQ
jgi:putative heme-binding domain-containing protein